MCDEAPVCACKIRIASLGSAAVGCLVAAVAVFVTQHLVLVAAALGVCAVGAVGLAHAVRRSARLSVVHWPAIQRQHATSYVVAPRTGSKPKALPVAPPRPLPAPPPIRVTAEMIVIPARRR